MDLVIAPIGWLVLFVLAVTIFGLLQCVANLRASKKAHQMEDLAEDVALLREELAQLRALVERGNGAAGETIDSIKVRPL